MYVQKDKWLSMLFQYIWREQISCVILLSSSGILRTNAVHTHTHTLQPTVPILCQTCQDTWVSGLLYRQTWGQLWQAWGNTRDSLKSKFSPDLTAVSLSAWQELGTSLWAPWLQFWAHCGFCATWSDITTIFPLSTVFTSVYNWQQHELNFI